MDREVYYQVESILKSILPSLSDPRSYPDRPLITLTFAQSLDGMISKTGQQVLISGKESLAMTHRLRTLHDGILVGIGTALTDDPQLNARYVAEQLGLNQPQPIIIDPFLKLSPTCKLIKNYQSNRSNPPWLIASTKGHDPKKKLLLESLGVKIFLIDTDNSRLPLPEVFKLLKAEGIKSLMIEGGSKIIQSCLTSHLYDKLIITIAPMFIGKDGVPAATQLQEIQKFEKVDYAHLGNDIIMFANQ